MNTKGDSIEATIGHHFAGNAKSDIIQSDLEDDDLTIHSSLAHTELKHTVAEII